MSSSLINLNEVTEVKQIPDMYWEVVTKKLHGVKNVVKLIRGQLFVELKEVFIRFDKHGRLVPPLGLESKQCDPDWAFHVKQPIINWAERLDRLKKYLNGKLPVNIFTDEYEDRGSKILERIKKDEYLSKMLNGPYVIGVIPQLSKQVVDNYGEVLEDIFLPAVQKAHDDIFAPKRAFKNYRAGELSNQVTVAENTRHDLLLQKAVEGNVVFVQCIQPLQGYSIRAQREVISLFPDWIALGGAIDMSCSLIQFIFELARDTKTPMYDCSALQWQSSDYSLYWNVNGDEFWFGSQSILEYASGDYSGSLVCFG
ncbi:MAG: hypothetical protein AAB657_02025 [Patescibacteria group bacterium]